MNRLQPGVCAQHAVKLLLVPPDPEHHPGHRDQRLAAVDHRHLRGRHLVCALHLLHQGHRDRREGGAQLVVSVISCCQIGSDFQPDPVQYGNTVCYAVFIFRFIT